MAGRCRIVVFPSAVSAMFHPDEEDTGSLFRKHKPFASVGCGVLIRSRHRAAPRAGAAARPFPRLTPARWGQRRPTCTSRSDAVMVAVGFSPRLAMEE